MMASKVTVDNFDRYRRDLHEEIKKRLARSAIVVERHAKQLLSASGTGTRTTRGVVRAVKTGKRRVYGAFPSAAGDPPRKQTGRLRGSVAWELVQAGLSWVARVGTNVKYGRWLELGTKRMAARPWLRRALKEMGPTIERFMSAPWKWSG